MYEQVDYAAVGIENALVGRSGRLSSHRPTSARENVCNNSELLKVSTSSHQHLTSLLRNADVVFIFTRNYAT